jgi:hypothetical protein
LEFYLRDHPSFRPFLETAIEGKWITGGEAQRYPSRDYPRGPPIIHVPGIWDEQRIPLLTSCLDQLEHNTTCWWDHSIMQQRYAQNRAKSKGIAKIN